MKYVLKKWPSAYNAARTIRQWTDLRMVKAVLYGTKMNEAAWSARNHSSDWSQDEHDWIEGYWRSQEHPHRQYLLERISNHAPFSSVLEIGCNCGPNLSLLARRFPGVAMEGIDINLPAIERGNSLLTQEGLKNVHLFLGKASELGRYPDKKFDIVFTDAVLIYIGSDQILGVLENMVRIVRKAILMLEYVDYDDGSNRHRLGKRITHQYWKRDYGALLKSIYPQGIARITPITKDIWPDERWSSIGALIEFNLKPCLNSS